MGRVCMRRQMVGARHRLLCYNSSLVSIRLRWNCHSYSHVLREGIWKDRQTDRQTGKWFVRAEEQGVPDFMTEL